MVRVWDLAAGKTLKTLTNHKKGIRGLVFHPREYTFASGAADHIKVIYLKLK
jgi:pleiotropic regulator 1